MKFLPTALPGLIVVEPQAFADSRGYFMETFHAARFQAAGIDCRFVQENHSHSVCNVLRGLHYQIRQPQGKLVRVTRGEVYDVMLDLRRGSPTFGQWHGVMLSEANRREIYAPPGFAHGFCVLSETADVFYSCTDLYAAEHERTILWSDPALGIDWPVEQPILSEKDARGLPFAAAPYYD